jgi:hypothetical protein
MARGPRDLQASRCQPVSEHTSITLDFHEIRNANETLAIDAGVCVQ